MNGDMAKRITAAALRVLLTAGACGAGAYLLYKYEYFAEALAVDNIVGMLPVAFVLTGAGAFAALVWMRHTKRYAPLAVALALTVALSAALFPNALRGNWWIGRPPTGAADQIDLSVYAPFAEHSRVAELDSEPTLKLNCDLPRLDGATAFYPVYAAFARAVYDRGAFNADRVVCSKTNKAYRSIIAGGCDISFTLGPSASQARAAEEAGAELVYTPIAREAFVFLAGGENPVSGLTARQIRNVYTGKTARWRTRAGRKAAISSPSGARRARATKRACSTSWAVCRSWRRSRCPTRA